MRQLKQSTVRVTPALAEKWLEANTHNRPISNSKVAEYAAAMSEGNWVLNGEAIVFDKNGVLVDGQHRLWACIEADVPFETVLIEGVGEDAFATIDTGMKRKASDVLHIDGLAKHERPTTVAIRVLLNMERGTMNSRSTVSSADILNFHRNHLDINEWIAMAMGKKVWTTAYAGVVVAVCYAASRRYPDKAKEFLKSFMLGENLQAGSPVLALRNRLGADKKLRMSERTALIIQAWNAYIENRKLAKMMMFVGDRFPTIKGA